jgi:hypothetical protein
MAHSHILVVRTIGADIQQCIAAAVVALSLSVAPAAADVLAPKATFQVNPQLSMDDDEATNVSGAACYVADDVRKSCLLIGDEVRYARLFSIDGNTVVPGEKLFLLPERDSTGAKFKETDAEGIAFADGAYYLVGSHGLNKKGKKQASRYFVYRIRVPKDTGRPSDFGNDKSASAQVERSGALERFIAAHPVLNAHVLDIPGAQGVNVEGIAAAGADLFFGFRGPVEQGAIILQAPARAVFDGDASPAQGHVVNLDGDGIRDLAAVNGGLLILSGSQERKLGKARVFFWKPGGERKLLADLGGPRPDGGQPEALLVMSETSSAYTVLVFSDSSVNGAPTLYEIAKQ